MSPEEFVAAVQSVVVDAAVEGEFDVLRSPPGRSPRPEVVRRSEWFGALTTADKDMVVNMLRSAARSSAFGMLCVLDGVRAFEAERGSLRLTYTGPDGSEVWLNDPTSCELHAALPEAP